MAELGESIMSGQALLGGLDVISNSVVNVVWACLALALVAVVFWYFLHRHKVRIRILTNSGSFPYQDKAREIKIDGVPFWKLLKRKDTITAPPSDALHSIGRDWMLRKPAYSVEMYWSEEDGYVPIVDTVNKANLKEKTVVYELDRHGQKVEVARDVFQPFTPQQRALYVSQQKKALDRRKKSLSDLIAQIAVPIAFVMFAVVLLFFWEDIAKPAKEMAAANQNMMQLQKELLSHQSEISAQNARIVQALTGNIEAGEINLIQRVPPDGATT